MDCYTNEALENEFECRVEVPPEAANHVEWLCAMYSALGDEEGAPALRFFLERAGVKFLAPPVASAFIIPLD